MYFLLLSFQIVHFILDAPLYCVLTHSVVQQLIGLFCFNWLMKSFYQSGFVITFIWLDTIKIFLSLFSFGTTDGNTFCFCFFTFIFVNNNLHSFQRVDHKWYLYFSFRGFSVFLQMNFVPWIFSNDVTMRTIIHIVAPSLWKNVLDWNISQELCF